MRRKAFVPLLALILAVSMVLAVPASAQAKAKGWGKVKDIDKFLKKLVKSIEKFSDLRFADYRDAEWAIECVAKMRGMGIINGYGGNLFKPQAAVSQSEVLTMMVRVFDLEDEANEMAERFSTLYGKYDKIHGRDVDYDDIRQFVLEGLVLPVVPASARWALGYILVAVDEGWVKISELNPRAAASREWVAMVMVRALGHEAQAQAKTNTSLSFTDAKDVSRTRVGYVAESVAMGLFNGYPDGKFQPKKSVSRAEMAAILERFLEDELPDHTDFGVKGKVTAVSSTSITVRIAAEQSLTFTISQDALITLGGKATSLDKVKVGDTVEILSNGKLVALLIAIKAQVVEPADEITGEIVAMIWPPALTLKVDGQVVNRTIELATGCTIREGVHTISFESLQCEDRVKVKVQSGKAVEITVVARKSTVETVTGIVQEVSIANTGSTMKVATSNTTSRVIQLAPGVTVRYGNSTLSVADIEVGDSVHVRLENGKATLVTILARGAGVQTITGLVTGLSTSTSGSTITVATSNTTQKTVAVSPSVIVEFGNSTLEFDDILPGDTVTLKVQNGVCFFITITNRESTWGDLSGTIKTITQTMDGTTILLDRGSEPEVSVKLRAKVTITYGDAYLKPKDLRINDVVRVSLENKLAAEIRVIERAASGS